MALLSLPVLAAEGLADVAAFDGPGLWRYLLVCGFLVGLVALLGYGFRRLVGTSMKARAARRSLETLDVLPLGRKQKLAVVRCYDRSFLIGLGEKEITLLAELDRDEEQAAPGSGERVGERAVELNPVGRTTGDFLRVLEREERRAPAPVPSRPRVPRLTEDGRGIIG